MSIVKMKKLRVTAMRAQKEELLKKLLVLGCVEVSEPDGLLADPDAAALMTREADAVDKLRDESGSVARALGALGRHAPVKSRMFIERENVSASEFLGEGGMEESVRLAERIERLDSRIKHTAAEEARLGARLEALLPWAPLDVPFENEGTRTSAVLLGAVPAAADFGEIEVALRDAAEEAKVYKVSEGREQTCLCVICLREKQEDVAEALRAFSFAASAPRGMRGTAAENIEELRRGIAALREERAALTEEIISAAARRAELVRCADVLATKIARAEAGGKFLVTESTATFEGWLPAPSEAELGEALAEFVCEWELRDPAPEEYQDVPVKLKNNALTSPLMMVTEMYSLPAYDGVDPNPLMMPFFTVFFGIMMGDMGYGLVMMLAALLVKRKKPQGGMKRFFDLLLLCGVSTFVFGIVTGGFFGDAIFQYARMIDPDTRLTSFPWPTFDLLAGNNTLYVLIGSMAIGFVQIIAGMAISFVKTTRDGHLADAVMDQGSWWLLFAGIALGALGVTWYAAIAGVVAIVLTQGRSKPTIPGKIIGGLGSLYDITGYFGDILSYSRLMALMLAGSVIALVFNTLAAQTGKIAFFIVFAIGHTLNFGLNLLGCYVHDLRLQCLEYFGKFYKDGGKPFRPLGISSKHVNIVNK
jgi:V/A-type H+-transporting ATPase subunit I